MRNVLRLGLSDDEDKSVPQKTATQPGDGNPDRADRVSLVPAASVC
jgi:hypothetical protein